MLTDTQLQLVNKNKKKDMLYFELRRVYLSPTVTSYQASIQLCKVLHVIQTTAIEYTEGGL